MTETTGGVKTLAIRLPDELHAQLVLVARLDGVSLAEAIRQAVEASINRRREAGELADQAQAALEQIEQESAIRRAALQALLGPAPARNRQRPTRTPSRPVGGAEVKLPPSRPRWGRANSFAFPHHFQPANKMAENGPEFGQLPSTNIYERNRIRAEQRTEATI